MFEQNELVVVKNLGDGNEYDGVIFGEIKIDDSFSSDSSSSCDSSSSSDCSSDSGSCCSD